VGLLVAVSREEGGAERSTNGFQVLFDNSRELRGTIDLVENLDVVVDVEAN
jgi:hypothetical protein